MASHAESQEKGKRSNVAFDYEDAPSDDVDDIWGNGPRAVAVLRQSPGGIISF